MAEKKFDIEDRLVEFAANIVFLCKELPSDMTGNYYGNQLLRSGGSSALNFGEAQGANTQKDKINKLALTLKELKESRVNLKIAGNNSSMIQTPDIMKGGLRTGPVISYMLKKKSLKKYARMYLMSQGLKKYNKAAFDDSVQWWQAGKGVGNIKSVESVADVVKSFESVLAK